jgi:hypothetical protein
MGMLRELLHARSVLEKTDDAERLKREIIRDSIYGVDIDPGAVDIARLRFFLSLVVDARIPEPLPNLDFKIMQGDSLSEAFDDVPVVFDAAEYRKHQLPASDGLFESGELERLNKRKRKSAAQIMKESGVDVLALLAEYYDPERSHDKKKQSREAIEDLELDTVRRALEGDIAEKQAEYEKLDLKARRNPKPSTEKARDKAGEALAVSRERLTRLDAFEASNRRERPWFLWHYYFHDVFESGASTSSSATRHIGRIRKTRTTRRRTRCIRSCISASRIRSSRSQRHRRRRSTIFSPVSSGSRWTSPSKVNAARS